MPLGEGQLGGIILGGHPTEDHSIGAAIAKRLGDYIETPISRRRPEKGPYPCMTYRVKTTYGDLLAGKDGSAEAEVTVSIWAETYDECDTIGRQVRKYLDHFAGMAWDRVITCSLHDGETDDVVMIGDATQKVLNVLHQKYKVQFDEPHQ